MILGNVNFKGGVAKSTTTRNMAFALAHAADLGVADRNYSVALVDLDSQGNLSTLLGLDADASGRPGLGHLLTGTATIKDTILPTSTEGVFLIPGSWLHTAPMTQLYADPKSKYKLRELTQKLQQKVDIVLIDCPPGDGMRFDMAMLAAEKIIIPTMLETLAVQGIQRLITLLGAVRDEHPDGATLLGILPTMVDARLAPTRDDLAALYDHPVYGPMTFRNYIPRNAPVEYAQRERQSIFEYHSKRKGTGYQAYRNFTREVLERCAGQGLIEWSAPTGESPRPLALASAHLGKTDIGSSLKV